MNEQPTRVTLQTEWTPYFEHPGVVMWSSPTCPLQIWATPFYDGSKMIPIEVRDYRGSEISICIQHQVSEDLDKEFWTGEYHGEETSEKEALEMAKYVRIMTPMIPLIVEQATKELMQ